MIANLLLAILIVLMIARDGSLAVRHRRPFRVAFLVFWVLLLAVHWTGRTVFNPAVAVCLVVALGLKIREVSRLAKKRDSTEKPGPHAKVPSLRDREIDGYWAGESWDVGWVEPRASPAGEFYILISSSERWCDVSVALAGRVNQANLK